MELNQNTQNPLQNGVELKKSEDSLAQRDQSYISISVFNHIRITSQS